MNNVDSQYLDMLRYILKNGRVKKDRTGVGTISVFDYTMRFNLEEGFPMLTTKKVNFDSILHELLWFLRGDTNIRYLLQNGVNIWNDWPHKSYCQAVERAGLPAMSMSEFKKEILDNDEFADTFGSVGKVYGAQWRGFTSVNPNSPLSHKSVYYFDQLAQLLKDLKNNPDSRRMLVTAWNPTEMSLAALPSCHYCFQCYTEELTDDERMSRLDDDDKLQFVGGTNMTVKELLDLHGAPKRRLSLKWNQRSTDCYIGLPYDIASYAILTHMLAQVLNYVPGDLIFSSGDTHCYLNHRDQIAEQLNRKPYYDLPKLWLNPDVKDLFAFKFEDVKLLDYNCHPAIKAPVAV